jgi:hypothetical protein
MNRLFFLIGLLFMANSWAVVNYPFPQHSTYANNGVRVTGDYSATIKGKFNTWWAERYTESGSQARIKFDVAGETVSEGIGYGMLLAVYMSDLNKSYEPEFQKLWNYYKNYRNGNGVMHWRISGFGGVLEQNGATDAELDVALALAMASYQFGNASYMNDARQLMNAIRIHELDGSQRLKPGDAWDDVKNPSYASTAALQLFASEDASNASTWNQAVSANYGYVLSNQNATSGLSSDWCTASGGVATVPWNQSRHHGYDAARTGWRMAHAYYWYKHTQAQTYLNKLASWANGRSLSQIKGPLSLGGNPGPDFNSTFIGGIGSAFVVSSTYQAKLNEYFGRMMILTYDDNTYFNGALRILYALTMTGNMPNFKNGGSSTPNTGVPPVSSSSTPTLSSSSQYVPPGSAAIVAGDNLGVSGFHSWHVYSDIIGSRVTPVQGSDPVVNQAGVNVAKATFNMVPEPPWNESNPPGPEDYPYAGMLLDFNEEKTPVNLSATNSISLTYKSTGNVVLNLADSRIREGEEWGYALDPTSSWRTINIAVGSFSQPTWVDNPTPRSMASLYGVKFEPKLGATGGAASIEVSSIVFAGYTPAPIRVKGAYIHGVKISNNHLYLKPFNGQSPRAQIFNAFGVQLADIQSDTYGDQSIDLSIYAKSTGVYFVKVTAGGSEMTLRYLHK